VTQERNDWTSDGTVPDAEGVLLGRYDDVVLLHDVRQRLPGNVSVETIPAGSRATVLFVAIDEPPILDLECYLSEHRFAFAHERADRVRRLFSAEEKLKMGRMQ
jgi:hypothetical protein